MLNHNRLIIVQTFNKFSNIHRYSNDRSKTYSLCNRWDQHHLGFRASDTKILVAKHGLKQLFINNNKQWLCIRVKTVVQQCKQSYASKDHEVQIQNIIIQDYPPTITQYRKSCDLKISILLKISNSYVCFT